MVKKVADKSKTKKISQKSMTISSDRLNDILVENFVNMQKTLADLTVKFDNLADQISKLLQLFEISAKSFAEKLSTSVPDIEKDREFLNKLNALLEQNKLIAKGLSLMEENLRERLYGYRGMPQGMPMQRTQPSFSPSEKPKEKKIS